MNLFQYFAIGILALLLFAELVGLRRSVAGKGVALFRCLIWIAAALAITFPASMQTIATSIGIGRGADVVLYLFVLAFLVTSFYFYARTVRLQRQITEIVRHIAIQNATRGTGDSGGSTG
jgi:hypothetical protein